MEIQGLDFERLTDIVTKAIVARLNAQGGNAVLLLAGAPEGVVAAGVETTRDPAAGYGCVLMTAQAYQALAGVCPGAACVGVGAGVGAGAGGAGNGAAAKPVVGANIEGTCCPASVEFANKRLLHERDLRDANVGRGTVVKVTKRTIVTALAHDYAKGLGAKIERV